MAKRRDMMIRKARDLKSMPGDADRSFHKIGGVQIVLGQQVRVGDEYQTELIAVARLAGRGSRTMRKVFCRSHPKADVQQELQTLREGLDQIIDDMMNPALDDLNGLEAPASGAKPNELLTEPRELSSTAKQRMREGETIDEAPPPQSAEPHTKGAPAKKQQKRFPGAGGPE